MSRQKKSLPVEDDVIVVLVEWADAHADEGGAWVDLRTIRDLGEYIVTSAGLLLRPGMGAQTGHVSIAQSWGKRDDCADHIIHIPFDMVRKIRRLDSGVEMDARVLVTESTRHD